FALTTLDRITHAAENLLSELRDDRLTWSPEAAETLLRLTATLRSILGSVAAGHGEGSDDHSELIATMERLRERPSPSSPAESPTQVVPEPEPLDQGTGASGGLGNHVRVDVALLDGLMNLVGELVLTRNQILQRNATVPQGIAQRLNLITTELQEGIMKARMQPIGNVWGKLPRIVRDLSTACGKQVRLRTSGQDVELDRSIIEAIKDPLTHLIRNAVDHGVEPPALRVESGKPRAGTLRLSATHRNGQVVLEVADDGAGIDASKVARRAVERGLVSPEQVARMSEAEIHQLIFLPGFSTADQVTPISGRGVGMDVVKTNVEAIGGTLEIVSARGQGTTIRLRIPLTLAIIPALIVSTGDDLFAIPQANLREVVRLRREAVDWIRETPVYRLRGNLLPLVDLDPLLGIGGEPEPEATTERPQSRNAPRVVIVQADGHRFGLIVGEVHDSQEIVVKPIGKPLNGLPYYSGAAILGNGRVALILDVAGLARESRIAPVPAEAPAPAPRASDSRLFLVGGVGTTERIAVPLEQVVRLEKIPADSVEFANGQEVVQYRDSILPLVRLPGRAATPTNPDGSLRVIVHPRDRGAVGIVVEEIFDVVEDVAEVLRESDGPGRVGSTVIGGRVTDLIDLPSLLKDLAFETAVRAPFKEGP
ncbi:MAG: chemotaxis protein CheA, partial [Isosphaeraceae bacterium]